MRKSYGHVLLCHPLKKKQKQKSYHLGFVNITFLLYYIAYVKANTSDIDYLIYNKLIDLYIIYVF